MFRYGTQLARETCQTNQATGPDYISTLFLEEFSSELYESLCLLLNMLLKEGSFTFVNEKSQCGIYSQT